MLEFKFTTVLMMLVVTVFTTFTIHIFGQSESPYANCILYKDDGYNVILHMDEDCDDVQFSQAVSYYKSHGYTHESGYSDIFGIKQMHLKSDKPF